MPPVETWSEHVGQQLLIDSRPRVRITTEVRNQTQSLVKVVLEVSGSSVPSPLIIIIR